MEDRRGVPTSTDNIGSLETYETALKALNCYRGDPVAIIDEALCIGCTHCRNACPFDAIVGAHHLMHTVIESECTGCKLCVEPCPVDCISMRSLA